MEFDPAAAPTESTMVRYFEERLKPSIKAEIDQDATHLDDYEELVSKAVRAEAKAGLRPSSYVREADLQVLRGSRPTYTTAHKVQTQEAVTRGDKSKTKAPASAPTNLEPSDKARKDKKKKQHRDKRDSRESKDTPASGVNAAEVGDKKRRRTKDLSKVTYYNCNKLGHYADVCPEPRKPKN